jgi:hypothetical protein
MARLDALVAKPRVNLTRFQIHGDRFALEALAQGSDTFVDCLWLVL